MRWKCAIFAISQNYVRIRDSRAQGPDLETARLVSFVPTKGVGRAYGGKLLPLGFGVGAWAGRGLCGVALRAGAGPTKCASSDFAGVVVCQRRFFRTRCTRLVEDRTIAGDLFLSISKDDLSEFIEILLLRVSGWL